MQEIRDILQPTWGAEKWLLEGWNELTAEERSEVRLRVDTMFEHGLPFTLKHDKMSYIRLFALLAQLEVLAIQVPLKFASLQANPEIRQQMRQQLLDEVFHGLVFTKISFMLSAPYAYPPAYDPEVEALCDFVRNEPCSKTAVVLLNLIAEGWIETFFHTLHTHDVAPEVFSVILADEKRHVDEADLYCAMGVMKSKYLRDKILQMEALLVTNLFGNYNYISLLTNFSINGEFFELLNQKYVRQLEKIGCKPGQGWRAFTSIHISQIALSFSQAQRSEPVELSLTRKLMMANWKNPQDPTMIGEFEIDISALDYFSHSDAHHRLNVYMLQMTSKMLNDRKILRRYIYQGQMRQVKKAYVALATRLPYCNGAFSYVVFENCHQLTHQEVQARLEHATKMQVMCFKRRQELEEAHPHLKLKFDRLCSDMLNSQYPFPLPSNFIVHVGNLGAFGFTSAKAPLRSNGVVKVTFLKVERKPVWNNATQSFVPRDMLPVSLAADHRTLDANIPAALLTTKAFEYVHAKWLQDEKNPVHCYEGDSQYLTECIDYLLKKDVDLVHTLLSFLHFIWFDSLLDKNDKENNILYQIMQSIHDTLPKKYAPFF